MVKKKKEKQRVQPDLEINGYPSEFIKRTCEPPRQLTVNRQKNNSQQKTFNNILYQSISGKFWAKSTLRQPFKLIKALGHISKSQKISQANGKPWALFIK